MLHPVCWPNHGPNLELYLAEEAIGLVKSMDWSVAKGPNWDTKEESTSEEEELSDSEELSARNKVLNDELTFSKSANIELARSEKIKDGDYVYGPGVQGVFFNNGVIWDVHDDDEMAEEDEWLNANLRESVARSSIIRCR